MFKEIFSKPKEWWKNLISPEERAVPESKEASPSQLPIRQSFFKPSITRRERARRNIINAIAKKSRMLNYAHSK